MRLIKQFATTSQEKYITHGVYLCECCDKEYTIKKPIITNIADMNCSKCNRSSPRKHGGRSANLDIKLYNAWVSMRDRCGKHKDYIDTKVTYKWGVYGEFYRWAISEGATMELTLDRINPYGNYTPDNCRWADAKMQAINKRALWDKFRDFGYSDSEIEGKIFMMYLNRWYTFSI